jgi:hypothetical protein
MSQLAALGLLAAVVVVAAVGGLVIGRMIATRIDRWQERPRPAAEESATQPATYPATHPATHPATEEPGDDTDPS